MGLLPESYAPGASGHLSHSAQIGKKLNAIVDVRADFGAVGDGVTDDTSAIADAIAACHTAGDPTATSRTWNKILFFPPGTFLATGIALRSLQGCHVMGAGPDVTFLKCSGSPTNFLDLDGIANGLFENFTITGGSPTKALYLHWSSGTYRSTTNNTFRNIVIRDCTFVTAIGVGDEAADAGLQVDGTRFFGVVVTGAWTAGNTTTLQHGWRLGNLTFGNNLDHFFYGCDFAGVRYGVRCRSTSFFWYGGQPAGCEVGWQIDTGVSNASCIEGVRLETAKRLVSATGSGSAPMHLAIRDVVFVGNSVNADGKWIDISGWAGTVVLDNVRATQCLPTLPLIRIDGGDYLTSAILRGVTNQAAVDSGCISVGPNHVFWDIVGYAEETSGGGVTAVTPSLRKIEPTIGHIAESTSTGFKFGGGATVTKHLTGSKTHDWASVADGAMASTTVTVTGAALGDEATASMTVAVPAGCVLGANVTATDTVTVTLVNHSGGAVDLASGTLRASVWRH